MRFNFLVRVTGHMISRQLKGSKLGRLLFIVVLLATPVAAEIVRVPPKLTIAPAQSPPQIFVEPGAGTGPVVAAIDQSHSQIDCTVYLVTHPEIFEAFGRAEARGVEVRLITEEEPFGTGRNFFRQASEQLGARGVEVRDGPDSLGYVHAKYCVFDRGLALITTANFTRSGFEKSREFIIIDRDLSDVAELATIFEADWNGRRARPRDPELVISPNTSRVKIEGLIRAATKSIEVIMEVFTDERIEAALLEARSRGVVVRILLPPLKELEANSKVTRALSAAGVEIRTKKNPFPHAKAMVVDGQVAYVGSVNFTRNSLDENREVGLLSVDTQLVASLRAVFERDWQGAILP